MIQTKIPPKVCSFKVIDSLISLVGIVELATAYKEDGNFNFKHKNYRLAVIAYTEGIKVKCGNKEIEATLFNNRSAANYHLKNYR